MVSILCLLSSTVLLAVLPTSVISTATSAEIFPSQRLRRRAAATQIQATHTQSPPAPLPLESEEPEVTVAVPAPIDTGSDGFPHLPAVSQMLSSASGTVKTVNSQASTLEARVVQAQMQLEAKLAKQKAAFEEKLKQQEANNRMVIDVNANITAEIKNLQGSNDGIRKHSQDLEEHSRVMRSQLHILQSRLGVAKSFIAKSLTATDDSKNALLQVLHGSAHRHGHALLQTSLNAKRGANDEDDDDEEDTTDNSDKSQEGSDDKDDDEDDEDESQDKEDDESFLALSSKVIHTHTEAVPSETESSELAAASADSLSGAASSNPEDLLAVLAKEVSQLAQQEKQSSQKLKELFVRSYKGGAQRKQALLKQQKALMTSRSSLLALQSQLKKAEAEVESTRTHLQQRLHGLGQYLQKFAHLAMAPQSEVPHILEVLPKAVTINEKLL